MTKEKYRMKKITIKELLTADTDNLDFNLESIACDIKDGFDFSDYLIKNLKKKFSDLEFSKEYSDNLHSINTINDLIDSSELIYNINKLGGRFHSLHIRNNEYNTEVSIQLDTLSEDNDYIEMLTKICTFLKSETSIARISELTEKELLLAEYLGRDIIVNYAVWNENESKGISSIS